MSDLRGELQAIYDKRGELTPKLAVAAARSDQETYPVLHARLPWDDAVAAERYREQVAHELIRSVRIVYKEATEDRPEQTVRAWHAVRTGSGFIYEPAEKVAADPIMSAIVLAEMRREWETLRARYGHFEEFLEMVRVDVNA